MIAQCRLFGFWARGGNAHCFSNYDYLLFLSYFWTHALCSYISHAWLWWWYKWGGLSESARDTDMCDCSSLKSIIQTLDLIFCFQCVIYTLRRTWGFMYSLLCFHGDRSHRRGTFPSSLKTFHVEGFAWVSRSTLWAVWTNTCNVSLRLRSTSATKQDQREQRSARLCCGLALLKVGVWRHISLIQVKAELTAPRAI